MYRKYSLAKDKKIDTSARSRYAALKKVSVGYCDLLLNSIEPIYSAPIIGQYTIPQDINFITIPDIQPVTFHIFIAKSSPRAYELLTRINQAILILQHNGRADAIFEKYPHKK
jgi:polar amino acid transport system substrate-binding protein